MTEERDNELAAKALEPMSYRDYEAAARFALGQSQDETSAARRAECLAHAQVLATLALATATWQTA